MGHMIRRGTMDHSCGTDTGFSTWQDGMFIKHEHRTSYLVNIGRSSCKLICDSVFAVVLNLISILVEIFAYYDCNGLVFAVFAVMS